MSAMTAISSEMETLKERLATTWNTGDYGRVARVLESSAEAFVSRIPIERGDRLLDLACGSGQVALPAARRGARVTGVDIAPNWIEQARRRAETEGLEIRFDVGDGEDLPYDDDAFDAVVSLIGAMFAPRPEQITAEMLRVCRPGGRIVMGNWTPAGFIGQMFKTVAGHVPPSPLMPSPLQWGDESIVRERLAQGTSDLRVERRAFTFDYPFPPAEVVDHFRIHFGPIHQAFNALAPEGQQALRDDLEALWTSHNEATDGKTYVQAEILEVVAVRA